VFRVYGLGSHVQYSGPRRRYVVPATVFGVYGLGSHVQYSGPRRRYVVPATVLRWHLLVRTGRIRGEEGCKVLLLSGSGPDDHCHHRNCITHTFYCVMHACSRAWVGSTPAEYNVSLAVENDRNARFSRDTNSPDRDQRRRRVPNQLHQFCISRPHDPTHHDAVQMVPLQRGGARV